MCFLTLQGVTNNRESHQIIFMLLMISLFSFCLKNLWVTLFILWSVFLYSFFKFTSGSQYISNILFGSILYLITKSAFKKEHINFFINGVLWLVFANIVFMSIQLLGYDFIFNKLTFPGGIRLLVENKTPSGLMGHVSSMGTLIALSIPLLATRRSKWAWVGAIGLFVPLYVCKTSLCLLMGLVGLLWVLYYRLPKKLYIALIIPIILLGFLYSTKVDKPGFERIVQWKQVLKDSYIHPFTGWGLDSYRSITPQKDWRYTQNVNKYNTHVMPDGKVYYNITQIFWWDNPHNLYISLIFEFSFIGLVLFMGYIRDLVLKFQVSTKDTNTIGLAGFIIVFLGISMGHFPIFLARLAILIVPCFALFEVSTDG